MSALKNVSLMSFAQYLIHKLSSDFIEALGNRMATAPRAARIYSGHARRRGCIHTLEMSHIMNLGDQGAAIIANASSGMTCPF